jgi:hypothetical protein
MRSALARRPRRATRRRRRRRPPPGVRPSAVFCAVAGAFSASAFWAVFSLFRASKLWKRAIAEKSPKPKRNEGGWGTILNFATDRALVEEMATASTQAAQVCSRPTTRVACGGGGPAAHWRTSWATDACRVSPCSALGTPGRAAGAGRAGEARPEHPDLQVRRARRGQLRQPRSGRGCRPA